MGAFLVVKKNKNEHIEPALEMLHEMGFCAPLTLDAGNWRVFSFSKLIGKESSFVIGENVSIVAVGTPIYKGLGYHDTLKTLLEDYCRDRIQHDELCGQYTILFCKTDSIDVLCDSMLCKHIFVDKKREIFSSSMLAVGQSVQEKLHINKDAIYEKFLTGIIMSPNTLFSEVQQVDENIMFSVNAEHSGIHFIQKESIIKDAPSELSGKEKCVQEQAETLLQYFSELENLSADGIDMGLSGGYDSRLVLACLIQSGIKNLHLHTHQTESDHKKDIVIAKAMANYIGVPCNIVPSRHLCNCEDAEDIIRRSVLFFDGRTSFSIGGCGETYTAEYRRRATQDTPMTLTGVGGELYRNVFSLGKKKYSWNAFIDDKIASVDFKLCVSDELYKHIRSKVVNQIKARLCSCNDEYVNPFLAQRYYCEIMMPDGQGNVVDAYNQISWCIAPFLEKSIIHKGYEGIPYHGSFGGFEGEMIDTLDHGLASIKSSYGYPLNDRPLKDGLKEKARTFFSSTSWRRIAGGKRKVLDSRKRANFLSEIEANTTFQNEALIFLMKLFPEIDLIQLALSEENGKSVLFMAATLYMFKEKIEYGI